MFGDKLVDVSSMDEFLFSPSAQRGNKRKRDEEAEVSTAKRHFISNLLNEDEVEAAGASDQWEHEENFMQEAMRVIDGEERTEYIVTPIEASAPPAHITHTAHHYEQPAQQMPQVQHFQHLQNMPMHQSVQPTPNEQVEQYQYDGHTPIHQPHHQVHHSHQWQSVHRQHWTDDAPYFPPEQLVECPASPVHAAAPVHYQPAQAAPEPAKKATTKKNPHAKAFADSDIFNKTASHLALTNGKKVSVTVGEIRRRMDYPEYQDWIMISRLARYARTNGVAFRRNFAKFGFDFSEETSDRIPMTISCLMEADAVTLGLDFNRVTSAELNKNTLASIVATDRIDVIRNHADGILNHLSNMKEYFFCAGRTPDVDLKSIDMSKADVQAVRKFSLETHGFGPLAAVAVIDSLIVTIVHMRNAKSCPSEESMKRELAPLDDLQGETLGKDYDAFALLTRHSNDDVIFDSDVLPRVQYDSEPIKITIGEIRRRIMGPEKFNTSLVCAYFRKAKTIDSQPNMRKDLNDVGIPLTDKARKDILPTSWSSLSEKEAIEMARETGYFLSQLPVSQKMKDGINASPDSAAWLREVAVTMAAAMERVGETPEQRNAESLADVHLLRFALISHHFGHTFYAEVMKWINYVLA